MIIDNNDELQPDLWLVHLHFVSSKPTQKQTALIEADKLQPASSVKWSAKRTVSFVSVCEGGTGGTGGTGGDAPSAGDQAAGQAAKSEAAADADAKPSTTTTGDEIKLFLCISEDDAQ